MAILKRLSEQVIGDTYTHHASLFGVPIYFNEHNNAVCVKNWWPEFTLDLMSGLNDLFVWFFSMVDPYYEPMFPIKLGKEIKPTK